MILHSKLEDPQSFTKAQLMTSFSNLGFLLMIFLEIHLQVSILVFSLSSFPHVSLLYFKREKAF